MTLWQFCDAHPVWALIYLIVLCGTATTVASALSDFRIFFRRHDT